MIRSAGCRFGSAFWLRYSTKVVDSLLPQVGLEHLSGDDDGISVLSLLRPEAKNALGAKLLQELKSTVAAIGDSWKIRCLVIRSGVPGIFCAGADLKERTMMSPAEAGVTVSKIRGVLTDVAQLPFPTIAVVEGPALGGGTELTLACDFRVGSDKARMGLPETRLGIIPGGGGTQRLSRLVGLSKAKELILTGRVIDSNEAHAIGLLDFLEPENAQEKAMGLAREIVRNTGPLAIRAAKRAIDKGYNLKMDNALAVEDNFASVLLSTKDRLEGLAAFAEKRKPQFKGE